MKYKKIILIGMMGSGKSTIAKRIAPILNYEALELDEIFEKEQNISISNFFKKFGEAKFRQIETQILKQALQKENTVISSGGGVILKKENRDLLFQNDILTIYLEAGYKTIYDRIKNDTTRPLLKVNDPKKEIENILSDRKKYYNLAKIKITTDNKTENEITEEILKWIK